MIVKFVQLHTTNHMIDFKESTDDSSSLSLSSTHKIISHAFSLKKTNKITNIWSMLLKCI